jgi:hypothetical protein
MNPDVYRERLVEEEDCFTGDTATSGLCHLASVLWAREDNGGVKRIKNARLNC